MKNIGFVFVMAITVLAAAKAGAGDRSCLETAMTQTQMNECSDIGYKEADAELNRVYSLIRQIYQGDERFLNALKLSRQAWIRLRDADLELKFPHRGEQGYYGGVLPMCEGTYKTRLTLERAAFLKEWLAGAQEGDVCRGSVAPVKVSARTAKALNSQGFDLYKHQEYEQALDLFRQAFEADDTCYHAHYNYACTVSILLTRDVCRYLDYMEEVLDHLEKTVQLKPEYKNKMRRDSDLTFMRQYYRFYMIAGYDVNQEKDLFEVLTSISWFGPKPGVYPASPFFKFNPDYSVKVGAVEGIENPGYHYDTGRFSLEGKTIRIKFKNQDEVEAEFKDGKIVFKDDAFDTLTDNEDLCGA